MINKYYSISEFSQLVNVKKQTLLWYDQIDLFKPIYVNESGYRFYSLSQIDEFVVIRTFANSEFSLKKISAIINKRSPLQLNDIFMEKEKLVQQKINELSRKKKSYKQISQRIDNIKTIKVDEILLEYNTSTPILRSTSFENMPVKQKMLEISQLVNHRLITKQFGTALGGIIHRNDFIEEKTNYLYYYTETDLAYSSHLKPAGRYIVTFYQGDYMETFHRYDSLKKFALKHRYQIGEYIYEQSLIDEHLTADKNEYITKIAVQVK